MAHIFADRVRELASAPGTGTVTLTGAPAGFRTFTAGIADGNTCDYLIEDAAGRWEIGIGTYTASGTTLARTVVRESTNSNAAVDFTGVCYVSVVATASRFAGTATYSPSAGDTVALDFSAGDYHRVQMPAGNITLAVLRASVGQRIQLDIIQDSVGGRTVTWFSTLRWPGKITKPTLTTDANSVDSFGITCISSGNYQGTILGQNIGLTYVTGGTVTTDGAYTIRTFTSSGTLNIVSGVTPLACEVLIVPGGGGGGGSAGGGGGGLPVYYASTPLSGSLTVTVGAGGAGGTFNAGVGGVGGSSSITGLTTATGGGGGGAHSVGPTTGSNGGGGGTNGASGAASTGGGYAGGAGVPGANYPGGGGGGAGGVGETPANSSAPGGNGGPGVAYSITGSSVYYGGGGGGGSYSTPASSGGIGGGGAGGTGNPSGTTGTAGTANTGGGGGGGPNTGSGGGNGGSGVVIIRYLSPV